MAKENEPAKLLLPYLQRADELQKHDPLVAYYCRLYAMERGLSIPQSQRTKTTNSLLVSLMSQLEKDRKSLKLGPDDNLHLEGFALNVFAKADKQDHAGKADLNTAKTFYAASIFFEILYQFGELQSDLEQKQKYAAWKAADIRKALKEGRRPVPGPPGNENDLSMPSISPTSENDLGLRQSDSALRPAPESDISSQFYDKVNPQHSTSILPSPPSHMPISTSQLPPLPPSDVPPSPHSHPPPSPHSNLPPSASYPADDYSPHNFHQPSPTSGHENSTYPQMYHHQPYMQEPQQQSPHNYPSHEASAYSYPNFQSYPSFTDTSLPAAPTHYPSYYQDCDGSYMNPTAPNVNYPSAAQYSSSNRNGSVSEAAPTPSQTYQYDINYQPPPEKIAEAHKAARFAVGALAFDDVSVAVDYLRKSLELLTIPSASH